MRKKKNYIKNIFIYIIKLYQKYISPILSLFNKCPYTPSCPNYMIEAIEKYGIIKGGAMGLWRILRCNPFSKGGYDPVP